ncbi:MAG: SufD family Fe-S cluster assembly protein [Deltaproteobacteria bacterium]|jgi:Fe-S cluster assembly protein SufD|nr:SufD family Fe-S cluster assembly protein [Deltaproteobacteria bacterium]
MIEADYNIQQDNYRWTDLKHLNKADFVAPTVAVQEKLLAEKLPLLQSQLAENSLVLLNGKFCKNLSNLDRRIVIWEKNQQPAATPAEIQIKAQLSQLDYYKQASLIVQENREVVSDLVLYLPEQVQIEGRVKLIALNTTSAQPRYTSVSLAIVLAKQAKLELEENLLTESVEVNPLSAAPYWNNLICHYYLAEAASLKLKRLQNETKTALHFSSSFFYQKANSILQFTLLNYGGATVRNEIFNILDGPGAESKIYGLSVAEAKQHFDNFLCVDHRASHCSSYQRFKGVYADTSVGAFQGSITVRAETQGNTANQSCANLLLSKTARVNVLPQLKIWSKDVKCNHGATVGYLNEEEIFYMCSRGIPLKVAQELQVEAFKNEIEHK